MSCFACRFEYVEDRAAMLERAVRQLANVTTKGPMTEDTVRAKASIIEDLKKFAEKWDERKCPHAGSRGSQAVTALSHAEIATVLADLSKIPDGQQPPPKRRGRPPKQRIQ